MTFGPGEIVQFALSEFWAIYFISAIFWLFFAQKIALMNEIAQNLH